MHTHRGCYSSWFFTNSTSWHRLLLLLEKLTLELECELSYCVKGQIAIVWMFKMDYLLLHWCWLNKYLKYAFILCIFQDRFSYHFWALKDLNKATETEYSKCLWHRAVFLIGFWVWALHETTLIILGILIWNQHWTWSHFISEYWQLSVFTGDYRYHVCVLQFLT